jgi:hypothetical protein
MRRYDLLCGILGLGTLGCGAGWHQPPHLAPGPWPPRQQVQVWVDGQAERWHGVVVGTDSMWGVLFQQPPTCDSCRRAVPLVAVDSVRVGEPVTGFWKTIALFVGIPFAVLAVICWGGCFPET